MEGMLKQPHIRLTKVDVTTVVLVVDNPLWTEYVAEMCDQSQPIAHNREYKSIKCLKDNVEFLVISSGVGSPGVAICIEELNYLGAKILIKAGISFSLKSHIEVGEIILCEAAIRDEGTSQQYIPASYPAISDITVYEKLKSASDDLNIIYRSGYTYTTDSFYHSKFAIEKLKLFEEANVDIVDMDVSTLFVLGKLLGIRTGALCCVAGSTYDDANCEILQTAFKLGVQRMLKIAIRACVLFSK